MQRIDLGLIDFTHSGNKSDKGSPPVESWVLEWTPLLSELLLRGEPR